MGGRSNGDDQKRMVRTYVASLRAAADRAVRTGASQTVLHLNGDADAFSRAQNVVLERLDTSPWLERWAPRRLGVDILVREDYPQRLAPGQEPRPGVPIRSVVTLVPRDDRFASVLSRKRGGLPELPGGKALPGESLEDAARREALEEVGVEVEIDPDHLGDFVNETGGRVYLCRAFVGRIAPEVDLAGGDEGDAAWATAAQLCSDTSIGRTCREFMRSYERWTERRG